MKQAQIDAIRQSIRPEHPVSDLIQLEARSLITVVEARQIMGIDPPDPDTPPEPGCDRCRGKWICEVHVNVQSGARYNATIGPHQVYRP